MTNIREIHEVPDLCVRTKLRLIQDCVIAIDLKKVKAHLDLKQHENRDLLTGQLKGLDSAAEILTIAFNCIYKDYKDSLKS